MNQVDDRKKLFDKYEKNVLPTLIAHSQQNKKDCQVHVDKWKKISEDMEDFTNVAKIRLKFLKEYRDTILKSDERVWISFLTGYNRDCSLDESLNQLNTEINNQISSLDLVAASGSTMVDSSWNVINYITLTVANETQLPVEEISPKHYKENQFENKKTIRSGFTILLPEFLDDFNDVIRDWESKKFRDMKCLTGLRTTIFEKFFGLESEKRKTTDWYKTEFFKGALANKAGYKYYTKVLFFILGDDDPNKYPPSLITQMIEIANNLSILQQDLSNFGKIKKQKTSDLEIELIFQDVLFYTAVAIKIRDVFRKN